MTADDTSQFVLPVPAKLHAHKTTIQHWQLRDLISSPHRREYFFCQKSSLFRFSTLNSTLVQELQLFFSPMCFVAAEGFLAAGGQRSQLTVKNLKTNSIEFNSHIGGSINNSISIARHNTASGKVLRLCVANNDCRATMFSLPEMRRESEIEFDMPVNFTSVSPDGEKLVAVGDSVDVFLFDVRHDYKLASKFSENKDVSHSCAWNAHSNNFAVACQDGTVRVWDIRSSRLLKTLSSLASSDNRRACRLVKFSPSPTPDLLLFTEHTSAFHLVDARTYNNEQIFHLSRHDGDENISGASFSADCNSLFVGLENGVVEFFLDIHGRRSFSHGELI